MEADNKRTYSKKRKTKNENKSESPKEPKEEPIGFGFWFTTALKDGRVKFWQDKEIFIFFKNRGLTDRELRSKYDKMLKLY